MDLIRTRGMRVLDPAALSGISQLRDYDGDVFAEITSHFCEESAGYLSAARRAIAAHDFAAIQQAAATLRRNAALMGAERMVLFASSLESAAEARQSDRLTHLLSGLVQAYYATCATLRFVSGGRRES